MSARKVSGNTKRSVSRYMMNVFISLVLVLGLMPGVACATTTQDITTQSLTSEVANDYQLETDEGALSDLGGGGTR